MENIIEFLINHSGVIVCCLLALVEILLLILKKPVKIDSIKERILEYLPLCISLVEKSSLIGSSTKKQACIDLLKSFIAYSQEYDEFVSCAIEKILCTPEKKGIDDGK